MSKFRDLIQRMVAHLPHPFRWVAVTFTGFLIIIIGIIMLPLPGPGTLIIFLGVTVLAIEFEWAREISTQGEQFLERIVRWIKSKIFRNPK